MAADRATLELLQRERVINVPAITPQTTAAELRAMLAYAGLSLGALELNAHDRYTVEMFHSSGNYCGVGRRPDLAILDAWRQVAQWAALQ